MRHPRFAASASLDLVELLVVANVGQDYRDLANAGKTPPAFTAPIRNPANFGSRCRLAAPLRRAMRGTEGAHRGSAALALRRPPAGPAGRAKRVQRRRRRDMRRETEAGAARPRADAAQG